MTTKWSTVAPFLYRGLEGLSDLPFDFENGVAIRSIPPWVKEDDIADKLPDETRQALKGARYAFVAEYEADSLGSRQQKAIELINAANMAAWVAKPSFVGLGFVASVEYYGNNWHYRQLVPHAPRLQPLETHIQNQVTTADLEVARQLLRATAALRKGTALWTAWYTLWKALVEKPWPLRYLLYWIVLEALFAPGSPGETVHQISERVALFLGTNKESALRLFDDVRKAYHWRSKVVHGMRLHKLGKRESSEAMILVDGLVRDALKSILSDPGLASTFSDDARRRRYLRQLPFSRAER